MSRRGICQLHVEGDPREVAGVRTQVGETRSELVGRVIWRDPHRAKSTSCWGPGQDPGLGAVKESFLEEEAPRLRPEGWVRQLSLKWGTGGGRW